MEEATTEYSPCTRIFHQMQLLWINIQSHPILLVSALCIYNLFISWILHRLTWQNETRDGRNPDDEPGFQVTNRTSPLIDGLKEILRTMLCVLSLAIDCIFRPISRDATHSWMDFELDENLEFLIQRFALPNLWLTPNVSTSDYLKYLPVWQFECCSLNTASDCMLDGNRTSSNMMKWIPSADCAICLDKFRFTVNLCGLPCGHQFHHNCIMAWLQHHSHHCPLCRWPAYQSQ